jgi:hypothetical protein
MYCRKAAGQLNVLEHWLVALKGKKMGDYTIIERVVLFVKAVWCRLFHGEFDTELPDIDAGESGPPYYICKTCGRTWIKESECNP